jgi:hypothetical protein
MGTERTTNLEHMDTKEFGQYTWIFLLFQLCDSCWHSWVAYESSLLLEFVTCGSHCTQSFLKVLKISKLLKSLNTCLHLMFRAHTHTHTQPHWTGTDFYLNAPGDFPTQKMLSPLLSHLSWFVIWHCSEWNSFHLPEGWLSIPWWSQPSWVWKTSRVSK